MFPYFHDQLLLVAASLNGGNVLEKFVDMIIDWNIEIGLLESRADNEFKSRLWAKLIHLGEQKLNDMNSISKLKCVPKLFAERHDKQTFASFENININNVNLGHVFASICEGLVRNLKEMITLELLIGELGCKRVIVTGNAIIRNPILKHYLQNEFDPIEIIYKASSDAAIGAANFLIDILNK
jgi:sedoheptulokinase